jgi:hypothetical protein
MNGGESAPELDPLPGTLVPYDAFGYPASRAAAPTLRSARSPVVQPRRADAPRRRPRRFVIIVAAAVVVLVTFGLVVLTNTGDSQEPEQQVREMFAALTARDGARLAHVLDCQSSPLCAATGITTGYEPPEDVQLHGRQRDGGDRIQVLVQYRLNSVSLNTAVEVSRYRSGMFGHEWHITKAPGGRIQLHSQHWKRARLASIEVPISSDPAAPNAGKLWAPPGIYAATTAGDALFEPATAAITVTGREDPEPATLPTAFKSGVADEVQRQIRARIDKCATDPQMRPAADPAAVLNDCPFGHYTKYTFTRSPKWTISQYPSVELNIKDDTSVTVHTTTPGKAQISYDYSFDIIEPRTWHPFTATEDITVAGTVTLDSGAVAWTG